MTRKFQVWRICFKNGGNLLIIPDDPKSIIIGLIQVLYEFDEIDDPAIKIEFQMTFEAEPEECDGNISKSYYCYLKNKNLDENTIRPSLLNGKYVVLYSKDELKKYIIGLINSY